jgi:hypothetical protein
MSAETSTTYRGRPLMIAVEAHQLVIREKGRRSSYEAPWLVIFELGARLEAERGIKAKRYAKASNAE